MELGHYLHERHPDSGLKDEPHINSKLKAWKESYANISLLKGRSGLGFQYSDTTIFVDDQTKWGKFLKFLLSFCSSFDRYFGEFSQQFWLLCVEVLLHLRAISVVEISFSASAAASAVYDEQQPQKWMPSVISTLIVAVYLKLEKVSETPKISLRHVPASQVKEIPEELVEKEVTILKD
ncbi:hypothetical protein BC332_25941 [Capsicum chinense]|nr:hypothetical protein BC332_25941 [Capsicum chinense]